MDCMALYKWIRWLYFHGLGGSATVEYSKNIIMVEFFDRHTILHCVNNEKYQTPYPLKYWLDKLKLYGFSQCYKSYIVNCQYVDYINKIDVILFNGKKIPISRHFRDSFRKDFFNNIGNRI